MKAFLLLVLTATLVSSLETEKLWKEFKDKFQRNYSSVYEETKRLQIFQDKLRQIEKHNALYEKGEVSYYLGINKFSDYTHDEYKQMLNLKIDDSELLNIKRIFKCPKGVKIPKHMDWRKFNVVTEVKDQKDCGSCWAFSTISALEGQYAIKYNELISLSVQNLLDCTSAYGNFDCKGGYGLKSLDYIKDYGINSDKEYPYTAKKQQCRYKNETSILHISGYEKIDEDEEALKYAVAMNGPIAVDVDISYAGGYAGGIYTSSSCKKENLNHAMAVVGYGTANGTDYWILKNSWSEEYGERGYIRFKRNANNMCGIVSRATRALVM